MYSPFKAQTTAHRRLGSRCVYYFFVSYLLLATLRVNDHEQPTTTPGCLGCPITTAAPTRYGNQNSDERPIICRTIGPNCSALLVGVFLFIFYFFFVSYLFITNYAMNTEGPRTTDSTRLPGTPYNDNCTCEMWEPEQQ